MKKGCLCALCGAIPVPIMNILKYFGDELKNDIIKEKLMSSEKEKLLI